MASQARGCGPRARSRQARGGSVRRRADEFGADGGIPTSNGVAGTRVGLGVALLAARAHRGGPLDRQQPLEPVRKPVRGLNQVSPSRDSDGRLWGQSTPKTRNWSDETGWPRLQICVGCAEPMCRVVEHSGLLQRVSLVRRWARDTRWRGDGPLVLYTLGWPGAADCHARVRRADRTHRPVAKTTIPKWFTAPRAAGTALQSR